MTSVDDDIGAVLLERAASQAAAGQVAAAGELAVRAAGNLVDVEERHDALVSGARLLGAAGRHAAAAAAWAQAAAQATDDAICAADLAGEGESARRAGAWAEAAGAQQRALELVSGALGEGLETAIVAQNLAVTYKYLGRFDDAERLYRRALTIAEHGGDDRVVAAICHNLGGLAHARGEPEGGVPWARRSVRIRETLGDDAVALAADRGALAGLLVDCNDLDEAAELLHAAGRTFDEHGDEFEMAIVDGNLAAVALRRGALDDADAFARAALAGKEAALGSSSPELAVTLTTLGTVCRQRGAPEEAVRLHQRALALLERIVEADHPLLRTIHDNLTAAVAATV